MDKKFHDDLSNCNLSRGYDRNSSIHSVRSIYVCARLLKIRERKNFVDVPFGHINNIHLF